MSCLDIAYTICDKLWDFNKKNYIIMLYKNYISKKLVHFFKQYFNVKAFTA